MTYNIINEPEDAKRYEFVVARPLDEEGTYLFIGMYKDGFEADQKARAEGAVVFHNVRIQGYASPKPKKFYQFTGTWSWGCWAESREDAIAQFDESYSDEYDFGDYDTCEIVD
jgi:hypothetical protein